MTYLTYKKHKGVKYFCIYENYRENGKVKHRYIKSLGTLEQILKNLEKPIANIEDISIAKVESCGEVLALYQASQAVSLVEIINKFSTKTKNKGVNLGKLVLIMVINSLCEQKSKNELKEWVEGTILPELLELDVEKLNGKLFCRNLDYLREELIENVETELAIELNKKFQLRFDKVFYDITSIYFEGEKCPLAFYGHSREHRPDKKQVVIGLVVHPNDTFPLYHQVYPGNTADVTTIKEVWDKLVKLHNTTEFLMVVDRGMISDKVRSEFKTNDYHYVSALKISSKEAQDLISLVAPSEFSPITVKSGRQLFVKRFQGSIKVIRHKFGLKQVKRKKFPEVDEIPYLYLVGKDKKAKKEAKVQFYAKLSKTLQKLKELQDKLQEEFLTPSKRGKKLDAQKALYKILRGVTKYFVAKLTTCKKTSSPVIEVHFKRENLSKTLQSLGKFVLFSSKLDLKSKEMLQIYIDKYQIEHAFRTMKSDMAIRPIRHRKPNRVKAEIFIYYLGFLLQTILKYRLKKSRLIISPFGALEKLKPLKLVVIQVDGASFKKIPNLTPIQQKISKSFKIMDLIKCQT
ncbi:MAG: IS1634 family transposase [Candidatus Helarchaeota archaeon]